MFNALLITCVHSSRRCGGVGSVQDGNSRRGSQLAIKSTKYDDPRAWHTPWGPGRLSEPEPQRSPIPESESEVKHVSKGEAGGR